MTISKRLDKAVERLSRLRSVNTTTQLALEEVAASVAVVAAERITRQDTIEMERKAKRRGAKMGKKIWTEVTAQPTKHKSGKFIGRATFQWQKDKDKKNHSVNIMTGGPARITLKSRKLWIKPKDGEGYFYGEPKEEGKTEPAEKKQGGGADTLAPPYADKNKDGVHDVARVGVPADVVPSPPAIPRLPNLTPEEQAIEARFVEAFERDPDGMADQYLKMSSSKFVTDDAKLLSPDYTPKGEDPGASLFSDVIKRVDAGEKHDDIVASLNDDQKKLYEETRRKIGEQRARMNIVFHQVANAVAKRAFIKRLDELAKLPSDDPKRTVLVTSGGCGCHPAGTKIMMADGASKVVQDISLGDKLMGPDSKPREVLCTIQGKGPLYAVLPTKGAPFIVNGQHVLSIKTNRARGSKKRKQLVTVEMTVDEYLAKGKTFKRQSYLYRVGVDFPAATVAVDPYFLGLWLGDGTHCSTQVTSADVEIAEYMQSFANETGMAISVKPKPHNKASIYHLRNKSSGKMKGGGYSTNQLLRAMRDIDVISNKHIPTEYMVNSREVRLNILAGLLDSDGSLSHNGFDFISKYKHLADQVARVARSLGMAAYVTPCVKSSQTGYTDTYHRVSISGHTDEIPTKIERKKASKRLQKKSVLHTGFEIEPLGEGHFYGFTLEGDGLYLLDDFTVTHNSGKGFAIKNVDLAKDIGSKSGALWDAAGEQNSTENPWIAEECKKRGLKPTFLFVDADPKVTWADPQRGVSQRAANYPPQGEGRMVDAKLFADSYALGAQNFKKFHDDVKDKGDAKFIFINSRGSKIQQADGISDETLSLKADDLHAFALKEIEEKAPTQAIKDGATVGNRIWKEETEKQATASVSANLRYRGLITAATDLQDEYQKFFKAKLLKYSAGSPDTMDVVTRKKFFDEIEAEWVEGKGPKKSSAKAVRASEDEKPAPAPEAKSATDEMKDLLIGNMEQNLGDLDGFYKAKWEDQLKMLSHAYTKDSDGKLQKPGGKPKAEETTDDDKEASKPREKTQKPADDKSVAEETLETAMDKPVKPKKAERPEEKTTASRLQARADAAVERLAKVKLPIATRLAVEEAAASVSAAASKQAVFDWMKKNHSDYIEDVNEVAEINTEWLAESAAEEFNVFEVPGWVYDDAERIATMWEKGKIGASAVSAVLSKDGRATVRVFLVVLSSLLTRYDQKLAAKEMQRGGRENIYRLGHYFAASERVEQLVKKVLDEDDEDSLRALQKALSRAFVVRDMPPVAKLSRMIDNYIATGAEPSLMGRSKPARVRASGYDPISTAELHEAIAKALKWSIADVQSFSLRTLRDFVRPVNAQLANEIERHERSGAHISGPGRRPPIRGPRRGR